MRRHLIPLTALAALLAGCGLLPSQACTLELGGRFTPQDTAVFVGDPKFLATITLVGCGGRETLHDTFTWTSSDTTVVTLSALPTVGFAADDGSRVLVTARKPGVAYLIANGERYHIPGGPKITVMTFLTSAR